MPLFACARVALPTHIQKHRYQLLAGIVRSGTPTLRSPTSIAFSKGAKNCLIRESHLAFWGLTGPAPTITLVLQGIRRDGTTQETTEFDCTFQVKSNADFDLTVGNESGMPILGLLLGQPFHSKLKSIALYKNAYLLKVDEQQITCATNTRRIAATP